MKSLTQLLRRYADNPSLKGGFGESFGKGLVAFEKYPQNPKLCYYEFCFPKQHVNIQQTVHGGALATMIDISTTISLLRVTPMRTISISLTTEFLSVVKLEGLVGIETEVTKIGKNIAFTDCRIFTGVDVKEPKLACRGSHIKSILADKWKFMD